VVVIGGGLDMPSDFNSNVLSPLLVPPMDFFTPLFHKSHFPTCSQEVIPTVTARMMPLAGDPIAVLDAVSRGIDLVSSYFPFLNAEMGEALTFPLNVLDSMAVR